MEKSTRMFGEGRAGLRSTPAYLHLDIGHLVEDYWMKEGTTPNLSEATLGASSVRHN